jgi:hypothetical protein
MTTSTEKRKSRRDRVIEDIRRIKQWGYQNKFFATEIAKNTGLKSAKSATQILKGVNGIQRVDHGTYAFVAGAVIA